MGPTAMVELQALMNSQEWIDLGRVDNYLKRTVIAANFQNAKKLRAVFSYRVATRRQCLAKLMNRSIRFLTL